MNKYIAVLALVLLTALPVTTFARGGGGGGRSGGFGGARSVSAPRVSAPSVRTVSPTPSVRSGGFQTARTVNRATPVSSVGANRGSTIMNTTHVNNYGGYGGGGGFFSGYLMGSMMHPFGFGYGMYGGGYGYGVGIDGGAYYPSTGAMLMSWLLSIIFLGLFLWLIIALIVL